MDEALSERVHLCTSQTETGRWHITRGLDRISLLPPWWPDIFGGVAMGGILRGRSWRRALPFCGQHRALEQIFLPRLSPGVGDCAAIFRLWPPPFSGHTSRYVPVLAELTGAEEG